ncbi:MAG: glycoside-pentoside-hexuronide (GPH):cation symporter [Clostridiales bacterium]|nr:glycoside-pentoside-hexuronide (GPH):cation symporter [Clostridiales bacterium]MCD7828077.1 glycoside-pentoside-hexuronide (GPH):cation symporter [Clostridiales bacterium]
MAKQEKTAVRPFGMRDRIGYAMGDAGCNLSFALVSNYMYLFYTQCIGLSAENWAWIIIVSKIWDAINDVLIGALVDSKQIGKSKFKPWIRVGSFALVAMTIVIFAPVSNLADLGKIIWCLVAYCLWSVAYTMVNVPYGSLHSVITENPRERTSLSTFRSIGAGIGTVCVMILPTIVYNSDNQLSETRIFVVSIIFSLLAFVFLALTRSMVTERVTRPANNQKLNYFATFKSYFTNRPLVAITIATVAAVACFNSTMSANNLVFQFFFNNAGMTTFGTIAAYIPLVALMPFTGTLATKFGKKKFICTASLLATIAGLVLLLVPISANTTGMVIYIVGLMFVNIGNSVFQIIVWAIIADCIELSYRKKGVRDESSLYALYSFFRKLAQGIGQSVLALALSATGYIESAATQTAEAAEGIKNVYLIFLLVGSAIVFLSMTFIYNISLKDEQSFANHEPELIPDGDIASDGSISE